MAWRGGRGHARRQRSGNVTPAGANRPWNDRYQNYFSENPSYNESLFPQRQHVACQMGYQGSEPLHFQGMPSYAFGGYHTEAYNSAMLPDVRLKANNEPFAIPKPKLNSHPPTNLDRHHLFMTTLMCGEKTNGKTYLAMYWLDFSNPDVTVSSQLFENDPTSHAESYLLNHLLLHLDVINRERLQSITIMQNATPCAHCANDYKEKLRDWGNQVVIIFSSFHWLRRLSCRHANHRHKPVPLEIHTENRQALRDLRDAGFTLRTTCYQDWAKLGKALQVPSSPEFSSERDYRNTRRCEEDDNLRGDLGEILG